MKGCTIPVWTILKTLTKNQARVRSVITYSSRAKHESSISRMKVNFNIINWRFSSPGFALKIILQVLR